MAERKHPPLNDIAVVDRFRVKAVSRQQGVHFHFQAHGPMGPNRPAEFTCHLYDGPSQRFHAHIETDTVATDSYGNSRSCATGRTLEELVHNLDWAHKPSELAQLKALLSTRQLTNCGDSVGDLVLQALSAEELAQRSQVMSNRAKRDLDEQQARMTAAATLAITTASEEAATAARFGLRQAIAPDLSRLP